MTTLYLKAMDSMHQVDVIFLYPESLYYCLVVYSTWHLRACTRVNGV